MVSVDLISLRKIIMKAPVLLGMFVFAMLVSRAGARNVIEERLADHFTSLGLTGCFVLLDSRSNTMHIYNEGRANQRFRPASTFKIPNAIIGLETAAIAGVDETIPYGGTRELMPIWEKDMSLREAMKVSNVAVFHQLAKRVGLPQMNRYLTAFSYGNATTGDDIESRFWLEGPLAISAVEQVNFLRRLATGGLNIQQTTFDAIREIIQFSTEDGVRIYAKTGWVGPKDPQIGWWVGWVEKDEGIYPFALNIDIHRSDDAKHRIPVALNCLRSLEVINAPHGATAAP